ncbi:MAG: hypothetical protein JWP97_2463 [Labilithrix sp.]|nr:hypothetical protein [Labilithrix sp.]
MRAPAPLLALTLSLLAATSACGGDKPKVDDPSTTNAPDDGTGNVKWEGASATPPPASTSSGSGGGATVNEGATRNQNQYDKESTEIAVKRAARQVKDNCGAAKDDAGKATGPWGKVTIQLALGHNGHSKGTTVPAPFQGKPVGNCIERAFTNLTFAPWAGTDTEITWEVELVQPAAEAAPAKK